MSGPAVHANCAIIGTHGIMIRGGAGSGKTSLCEILIEAAAAKGNFARLVADDYVHVSAEGGRLLARVPETIRGRMEVRNFGLVSLECEPAAQVHLIVNLQPLETLERLPESPIEYDQLEGIRLPVVICPEHKTFASFRLIRWALRSLFPGTPDYI